MALLVVMVGIVEHCNDGVVRDWGSVRARRHGVVALWRHFSSGF